MKKKDIIEDPDIDLFLKLEEALKEDGDLSFNRSNLAEDYPRDFVQDIGPVSPKKVVTKTEADNFHELFAELQGRIAAVKNRESELRKNEEWVVNEKRDLQKQRTKLETDRMLVNEKLGNAELLDIREKYEKICIEFEESKASWDLEKMQMLSRISELEKKAKRPNVTFVEQIQAENDETASLQKPKPQIEPMHVPETIEIPKNVSESPKSEEKIPQKKVKMPKLPKLEEFHLDFAYKPRNPTDESIQADGRKICRYRDGSVSTVYRNGTQKIRHNEQNYVIYANGDVSIEDAKGIKAYRYHQTGAIEIELLDGSKLFYFPENQIEKHHPNGEKEIQYKNGQYKKTFPNGDYELYFTSGKVEKCYNKNPVIFFN